MRYRVQIQSLTQTQDSNTGGITDSWATVATRWGSADPIQGEEVRAAAAAEGKVRYMVGMRYYDGLTSKHRLMIGTQVLNIEAILNKGSLDAEMEILAWEQT